jgi:hypothetical protein
LDLIDAPGMQTLGFLSSSAEVLKAAQKITSLQMELGTGEILLIKVLQVSVDRSHACKFLVDVLSSDIHVGPRKVPLSMQCGYRHKPHT